MLFERRLLGPHALAFLCLVAAYFVGGPAAVFIALILALLELMVSAVDVVVSATFLARLSRFWQKMYLTVGLVVSAVGARFGIPLALVCLSAKITPAEALRQLFDNPDRYDEMLKTAQPILGMFVGVFLMSMVLEFAFTERELYWFPAIEKALFRLGRVPGAAYIIPCVVGLAATVTVPTDLRLRVAFAVLGAVIARVSLKAVAGRLWKLGDQPRPKGTLSGRDALRAFCALELLNTAVSIDSVASAFSLTLNVALIALGLVIGVVYGRSATVIIVRRGTFGGLLDYEYLEHGKYYALAFISIFMFWSTWRAVPGFAPRSAGAVAITAAWLTSVWKARAQLERAQKAELLAAPEAAVQVFRGFPGAAEEPRSSDFTHPPGTPTPRPEPRVKTPLYIYLADGSEHAAVERAVDAWLTEAGFTVVLRKPPTTGSWKREIWVGIKAIADAHGQAAQAIPDATAVTQLMDSTARVLASLENSSDAAIRFGPLLIIKADGVPIVTHLNETQVAKLDLGGPAMLESPRRLIRQLGLDEGSESELVPETGPRTSPAARYLRLSAGLLAPVVCGGLVAWLSDYLYRTCNWPPEESSDRLAIALFVGAAIIAVVALPFWEWASRDGSKAAAEKAERSREPAA